MWSLFKKETIQFFGSPGGYLILSLFLVISSLFLWFFDGSMNLTSGGYATMDPFFAMAPWLYLLFIPALTMRLFAEERRTGTLELILIKPLSPWQVTGAKLLAVLFPVLITLLLSAGHYLSVYYLGSPVGSVDSGAVAGSLIGLLMLAFIFASIGMFASAMSDNQIVALVSAVGMCYLFYAGFELFALMPIPASLSSFLSSLSISAHYDSISRGVADSRDLLYFLFVGFTFICLTILKVYRNTISGSLLIKGALLWVFLLVFSATISSYLWFRIDFTKEKRYTLSDPTLQLLQRMDHDLKAEILLEGELQPGFRRLQEAVVSKLTDFSRSAPVLFDIEKFDPYKKQKGSNLKVYFDDLIRRGVEPIDLRIKTDQGYTTRMIFPTVVLTYGDREEVVNLLRNDPTITAEENLNRSVELLEYELTAAINRLVSTEKKEIAFLSAIQEPDELSLKDITHTLSRNYTVGRITSDELLRKEDALSLLMVVQPGRPLEEREKFAIDHYLMKGGKILWVIDPVRVSLDSLSQGMTTIAIPGGLNIDDQLFKYGARLNSDLIQDVECINIKVNTSPDSGSPRYEMAPWYFSPLMRPVSAHPVGKSINPVYCEFVSSIDPVGEEDGVRKSVLLSGSRGRRLATPQIINLGLIDRKPDQTWFNQEGIVAGMLLEGEFGSLYANRMISDLKLPASVERISRSKPTAMILFSDASLIVNRVNRGVNPPQITGLGYDRVSKITFGNRELIQNAVGYLCDDQSLMSLRTKSYSLRMLDKIKLAQYKTVVSWANLLLPLLLLLSGGMAFAILRKKRAQIG